MASLRYTSPTDLETVLSPQQQALLTDDNSEGDAVINEAYAQEYLSFAESIAESYVPAPYTVPLETAPPAFKYIILVIAKYNMFMRRGHVDEGVAQEYRNAMDWLMMLKEGIVELPVDTDLAYGDVTVGFADRDNLLFNKGDLDSFNY